MITQSNEEIKEQLTSSSLHLQLHSPATLECASTSDYESEVMSSELGVSVGRVGICVACGGEDGAALDSGFCLVSLIHDEEHLTYANPVSAKRHASARPDRTSPLCNI